MQLRRRRIGLLVFDGVTALDLVGPSDAFTTATLPAPNAGGAPTAAYEVITIGLTARRCVAESGLVIHASHALADVPPLDTLIVPGGSGLRRPAINRRAVTWITARARGTRRVAAVCTGIYGLAPRSSSMSDRDRSMPAVTPADV